MQNFFNKLKTNFPFRKKVIIISAIVVLAVFGMTIVKVNGTSLLASVIAIRPSANVSIVGKCTDSDGGRDFYVKGTTKGPSVTNNQIIKHTDQCNNFNLTEYFCNPQKKVDSVTFNCEIGCSNGACIIDGGGYGYGYGYSRTGGIYGYGYGYGYKKMDSTTNKPWMYLLIPFKNYTRAVYDAVIQTIGFQMVKSYNKKEFTAPLPTSSTR